MKNKNLSEFFSTQSLYKPVIIDDNYTNPIGVESPFDFQETTFSYYCTQEQETRTFEIELPKSSSSFWGSQPANRIPKEALHDDKIDFIHHLVGVCRSCRSYHVDFLVHVWSTEPVATDLLRVVRSGNSLQAVPSEDNKSNQVYIEKLGVSPEIKPIPDKELVKYFSRETNSWYFKGKKALNENLGIGAFAYFRRIIEKELISIVNDIAHLNSGDSAKINALLAEFNKSGKVHLLYESVFQHLPKSLQSLGYNPLKTLYQQTSQGLHDDITEEECLKKAGMVDLVLTFVIKKINEEKSDILDVRNALKQLNT